jgi:uncharacterized protein (TIGR03083 family)
MTDDRDLEGLNPYDLMDREAARLDAHFAALTDDAWEQPSRCDGWSVRDVLAHLAASEVYNRACLTGTVQDLMAQMGERGVTDIESFNEVGIRDFDGVKPGEILDTWRERCSANREGFRARDGEDVDSSVGAYPGRWQAFHLAFELAVHADDVYLPVQSGEANDRLDWQVKFARFALKEMKNDAKTEARAGATRVQGGGIDVEVPDSEFVAAAAARLPEDTSLAPDVRAYLSVTP